MQKSNIISLLEKAIKPGPQVWAELGSGDGAFTMALRELAGERVEIYSVDRDRKRLAKQRDAFVKNFPNSNVHFVEQDFTQAMELPPLDGILMANSLHYVKDQIEFLKRIAGYLKSNGRILIVEYQTAFSNPYVPHPVSFEKLEMVASQAGLSSPELLAFAPSRYWGQMYSAIIGRQ